MRHTLNALRRGAVLHYANRSWIIWDAQALIAAPVVGYTFRPIRTDYLVEEGDIPGFGHLTHGVRFGDVETIKLSRATFPLAYATDDALARMSRLLERVAVSVRAEGSRMRGDW